MQLIAMNLGPLKPEKEHLAVAAVLFASVHFLVRRMLPRINRVLDERAALLDVGADSPAAELRREAGRIRAERESLLAAARREAAHVRQQAREEGAALIAAAREDGLRERDEVITAGQARIATERASTEAGLRAQVPELASELASRIVGEPFPTAAASGR
jgi:F-type H+-transporting ATPase subunit b